MSIYCSLEVILAEEVTPYFVDNNISAYQNSSELVFAYTTYDEYFSVLEGDLISAECSATISPTGGNNPVKVLQILESAAGTDYQTVGKIIGVYQDTSPGNSFTYPGNYALGGRKYTFFASSTSNGTGWYFLNLFNINITGMWNNYTIDQVYIAGYTNVYPNLAPGANMAIPNPNGDLITASTVDVHITTPNPYGMDNLHLILSYQSDGAEYGVYVYGTGWYSIPLSRNVDTSQGGINIELANLN